MRVEDPAYAAQLVGSTLRVRGELDSAAVDHFARDLDEATAGGSRSVVVDLAATTFLCSRAIAQLVTSRRRCLAGGADLTVVSAADGFVARVLDLCEVEHVTRR